MGVNEPHTTRPVTPPTQANAPSTQPVAPPTQAVGPSQPARFVRPATAERPTRGSGSGRPARQRDVRLHIGELALEGFGPGLDGDLVSASFQAERTRLVERRGVPLAAGRGDRVLDALALTGLPPLPSHAPPARIGEALARAVHAGLSGQGQAPRSRRAASRARHAASGRNGRGG